MLKTFRKKGFAKKVLWFVAIIIIFSFGFFGTAYLITGDMSSSYAGTIFGKKIPVEDFNKVYRNARIQAIRQYGYNLSKVAHLLNLEGQTWDLLILLHEAKKRHIRVSNEQVVEAIENDNSFKKNGQFDMLVYNSILRNLQIRPRDYEENVRDNLKIEELFRQVTSAVTISEDEVYEKYKDQNEKVQTSYVLIKSDDFIQDVDPQPADIQRYYDEHAEDFKVPPSVNVRYISLDFPQENVEDEEGAGEETEEAADNLEQQKDLIREKADNIFEALLVDPDMEKIAGSYNVPVKTTGFFSMEQPNLSLGWSYDLLNRIFQMNLNEVNEPFETPSGISIVQIKEKRDAYVPEFSEIQDDVRSAVALRMAKDVARTKAEEDLEAIKTELDRSKLKEFPKAAEALGLEIQQTPLFNRGQYLPQVGISKSFQEAAFGLGEQSKLSDVVEVDNGYCILYLDNVEPVDEKEFAKAKEDLALSISQEKQNNVFGDYLAQLRMDSGLIDNIPELRDQAQ